MKKLVLLIGLVAFLGMYIIPQQSFGNTVTKVVVDGKKCEKCGKEGCDGSCDKTKQCDHKKEGTATEHKCAGSSPCCKNKTPGTSCSHGTTETPKTGTTTNCPHHNTENKTEKK